jgi:hypothetical protein
MNQFWENTATQFNCTIKGNDESFFIPMLRTDPVFLRLVVPWQLVQFNGGGLPNSGANVSLSIVDETDSTTYFDYSGVSSNRFRLGTINDGTNKHAEYQILAPFRVQDENGENYAYYYFDVVSGDVVELDDNGTIYSFIYGKTLPPEVFWEYKSGRFGIGLNVTTLAGVTLKKNNVTASLTSIVTSLGTAGAHENFNCFRFKLSVNFATYGQVVDFYTKPFKIVRCNEDTIYMSAQYPLSSFDCEGHKHESSNSNLWDANRLSFRLHADVDTEPSRIEKKFNDRQFTFGVTKIEYVSLKSDPIPLWMERAAENILCARDVMIDNVTVYNQEADTIAENPEINGFEFRNLNVLLQLSKCELTFVCS